jgi:hypothetical protein
MSVSPLSDNDAALAADLFHQAYLVLPLASTAHSFRIRIGPDSRTRVYKTLAAADLFTQHAAYAAPKMAVLRTATQPPWSHNAELSRRALTTSCHAPALLSAFSIITEGDADISGGRVNTAIHVGGRLTSNPDKQKYQQRVRSQEALT